MCSCILKRSRRPGAIGPDCGGTSAGGGEQSDRSAGVAPGVDQGGLGDRNCKLSSGRAPRRQLTRRVRLPAGIPPECFAIWKTMVRLHVPSPGLSRWREPGRGNRRRAADLQNALGCRNVGVGTCEYQEGTTSGGGLPVRNRTGGGSLPQTHLWGSATNVQRLLTGSTKGYQPRGKVGGTPRHLLSPHCLVLQLNAIL